MSRAIVSGLRWDVLRSSSSFPAGHITTSIFDSVCFYYAIKVNFCFINFCFINHDSYNVGI